MYDSLLVCQECVCSSVDVCRPWQPLSHTSHAAAAGGRVPQMNSELSQLETIGKLSP